jgi:orotate phosphoribosyltransferase
MLHAAAAAGERCDAFVVRKEGKAHGLQQRIEGPSVAGRRVLVVEDTTTTGASPIAALRAVREAGGEVVAVATIADRATGAGARSRRRASHIGSSTRSRTSASHPTKFSAPLRYFAGTPGHRQPKP